MTEIATKPGPKKRGFMFNFAVVVAFIMIAFMVSVTMFSDRDCLNRAVAKGMSNSEAALTCAGDKALSQSAN